MSIACAMIVRDGADSIDRCVASVRPHVAELCVYLAGESKDRTVKILDRLAHEPGAPLRVEQGEWRDDFAWAREQSFAMVPAEYRWLIWLDADDELVGGEQIPAAAALAEQHDLPVVFVNHAYDWLDGTRRYAPRERIVDRTRGTWRGIVHETFQPNPPSIHALTLPAEVMHVRHQASAAAEADGHAFYGKSPGHYLPLILKATEDVERTPRAYYFLAREYAALGRWDEALRAVLRYISERHDRIEGLDEINTMRLDALALSVGIAEHAEDDAVEGWLRHEHNAYAGRVEEQMAAMKSPPGRNKLCWCGSGKKFKKCHGA